VARSTEEELALSLFQGASGSAFAEESEAVKIPQQGIRGLGAIKHADSPCRQGAISVKPLTLSILVPAYNEEKTITQAIQGLLSVKYPCDVELIVVDDGSTDQTPALLAQVNDARVIVHRHSSNLGKGAGLISAASLATGSHILPFDADLEYSPDDIPKMLAPVIKGRCNVVYGVRLFGFNTVYQSYRYAKGNRVLTRLANLLFDACLSDLHTCLKLMPLSILKTSNLSEAGFGLDTELTALLLRRGIRPFEVPVSYYSRSHAQGKKITWRDAAKCVWVLLRVRLKSRSSLLNPKQEPPAKARHPLPQLPDPQLTEQLGSWVTDDERGSDVTAATI
jgi:dolichol-phosphate hexosyltransferase